MGFESMYIGATGMKTHGLGIDNLANNLANVNTLGFKSTNAYFENLLSDSVTTGGTATGLSQQGHGVRLSAIITDFSQGAPIEGSAETDLAITGNGFFRVVKDSTVHYTRAGNFRFNKDGYLVDPHGFRVQGRNFPPPGSNTGGGTVGDIQLNVDSGADGSSYFTIDPIATTSVSMSPNLGFETDGVNNAANPFFSLLSAWDANSDPPLSQEQAAFSNTIKVYDANGTAHNLTVYFDAVDTHDAQGRSHYEYVVGIDPDQDGRAGLSGTDAAGLLMAGTLTFSTAGEIVDMSAYTLASGAAGTLDLASWTPAAINAAGFPAMSVTFAASNASAQTIAMNFGLSAGTSGWTSTDAADSVGSNASNLNGMASATPGAFASTNYIGTSSILYETQNGFARGYLQGVDIDRYGTITGRYSNGMNADLYQITLYTFNSPYGLYREGNNHFSATPQSGTAFEGSPGDYNAVGETSDDSLGLGYIQSNAIESSNVDVADQFATMIITERGFQANSKVITTTDAMLQSAIQMKR
jgi:flagellar hook protein FlgE